MDENQYKILHDYLKHLTTLSTGSIVLIVMFLEKLFTQPIWQFLIIISLIGFIINILTTMIARTISIFVPGDVLKAGKPIGAIGGFSLFFSWLSFFIGITSLAVFAIRNLV